MSSKTKTIIVVDDMIKNSIKAECAINGTTMSAVTESLWVAYITQSREQRAIRYAGYKKEQETSKQVTDERVHE